MDASHSLMSDETRLDREIADPTDAEAPTERDPRMPEALTGAPPRGVALSVLWWLEGDEKSPRG